MVGFNFAPVNWSFANGAVVAISQNEVLFNLIGTTYGGDGVNTYALPNLQGRMPMHMGSGRRGWRRVSSVRWAARKTRCSTRRRFLRRRRRPFRPSPRRVRHLVRFHRSWLSASSFLFLEFFQPELKIWGANRGRDNRSNAFVISLSMTSRDGTGKSMGTPFLSEIRIVSRLCAEGVGSDQRPGAADQSEPSVVFAAWNHLWR